MNLHMAKMYWKKMVDAVEFERAGGTHAGGLTYLLTYLLVTWMKICRLGMERPTPPPGLLLRFLSYGLGSATSLYSPI